MKHKIKIWGQRYLLAEIIGTLCAIIIPTVVSLFSKNILIIALAGTWGENMGYYGVMIIREISQTIKKYKELHKQYGYLAFVKNIRNIFLEFGVAETIDSLFVRPTTMYLSINIFQNIQLGILMGKIMADVIFYIPTIISYELRKKHLKD